MGGAGEPGPPPGGFIPRSPSRRIPLPLGNALALCPRKPTDAMSQAQDSRTERRARLSLLVVLGLLAVAGALLFPGAFVFPGGEGPTVLAAATEEPPSHEEFSRILERVVRFPSVDYALLKEERPALERYVAGLGQTDPRALDSAPREVQLAFWINAYNACMLRLVADHYPIEGGGVGLFGFIRNRVAGYPDNSVWQIRDVFTRAHCPVAGRARSQDEIEHEIIRPRFQEPRIHFAVNCAAVSCPPLWPDAYTPAELDRQQDRAVLHLMESPEHFRLEGENPATLTLNKVLDWYSEDFGGPEGLREFFAGYLEGEARERVLRSDTRVRFFEYDWTLNDVPR
jgi:hypothetical protein